MDLKVQTGIMRWYRCPGLEPQKTRDLLETFRAIEIFRKVAPQITSLDTELCYHVEVLSEGLTAHEERKLAWILGFPHRPQALKRSPHLTKKPDDTLIEIGPRFNFSTPESSNSVSICRSLKLDQILRIEVSTRYLVKYSGKLAPKTLDSVENEIARLVHDRMTECRYTEENIPKYSFNERLTKKDDLKDVDVMKHGRKALEQINNELGLAFDEADLEYYTELFKNKLKRNPTSVECFDLAQSNSEHSRHWFFKGKMVIDGKEHEESLIDMIIATQNNSNPNNVIKFSDNSSAIQGYDHTVIHPKCPEKPSELITEPSKSHLIFTAETHNFPTGVAPFSGATTGTGGRIRDVEAVGRGGFCIAGTAGYSTGNLRIPDYEQPWEDDSEYPDNFASPLEILVEASNGASDYGNKFGEPLICGFTRTFGLVDNTGERKEYIKPIMFSGGVGFMDATMVDKQTPEEGMHIVKIGGPVYRIGVGGGAASSVQVQGDNNCDLDFNAVQRGDAEMEQKLNRVVRACLEKKLDNPIVSIHDQGAGGNGNVLKELVEPVGGVIYANRFDLGDPTINALELWGAEYQENNALLCRREDEAVLKSICERERCPVNFVGEVRKTGKVVLALDESMKETPFNLELSHVLGKMPRKVYNLERHQVLTKPLTLNPNLTVITALNKVLRLPAVCSKRFLTNKVDRCVTGLIAQQQCVGPLHTPLADVAVTAISYCGLEGVATAIGEQPIKGLLDNGAGARMTVAESLTNLVFAGISDLKDVKCSGNWMWAAKLPGEGAALYDTCQAMCKVMGQLGIAIDGGKDSLSMAARVGAKTIKAPGTLVVSTYAPCPDVRKVVTPDLKAPARKARGALLYVDLSDGKCRLGGSALAQCHRQLGHTSPDLDDPQLLVNAFNATQYLIKNDKILAGHDISDGGLVTCLLEMGFAGISGMSVQITHKAGLPIPILFAEELGLVLEVLESDVLVCLNKYKELGVPCYKIGESVGYGIRSPVSISINGEMVVSSELLPLFMQWEETSFRLELRQAAHENAHAEFNSLKTRTGPKYQLTFNPDEPLKPAKSNSQIRVAVLREEGTNGDREMAAILMKVGFNVWDVTMQDLVSGTITLDSFQGVIFPGGFSYADVLGSAKGWAASILFNEKVNTQFNKFLQRKDTFSLGVCNGCQLMSLIGWVGSLDTATLVPDITLDHNTSGRFECRWTTVKIEDSISVMLKGMEGSVFGVWAVHGEGRFTFRDEHILKALEAKNCVALRYVDDNGMPTEEYPMNQNGSVGGLAGVCSADGRHLAMMPHPERCAWPFQFPYVPHEFADLEKSPWERMFQNAYDWCLTV